MSVERRQLVADIQSCPDGALRVVFVGHRQPKDREHGITEEVGDRSPGALDHVSDHLVESADDFAGFLWVELLDQSGRAHQVGEHHRDDLAGFRGEDRPAIALRWHAGADRRPAVRAELRSLVQRRAAFCAGCTLRLATVGTEPCG